MNPEQGQEGTGQECGVRWIALCRLCMAIDKQIQEFIDAALADYAYKHMASSQSIPPEIGTDEWEILRRN